MKYHKIFKVNMDVCTAEQKIAYNLAFSYSVPFAKEYNAASSSIVKSNIISDAIHSMIDYYISGYSYKPNKYNIDAVFCALQAGLENYINANMPILTSYEHIGKMFPANYLEV